ncbi:MAG: ABC transporter permease [Acidobacteria bacterium]|nr:ABC transporter permease [Acidobacteriota bacterium]
MFSENLRIALKSIAANKLRSVLTTLGIMIGVASVIAVVSLVQGLKQRFADDLEGVGATYVLVFPDAGQERNTMNPKIPALTYEDGMAVLRQAPEVRSFTPIFYRPGAESKRRDLRHSTTLLGVGESYQEVVNHWVDRGRFFTALDMEARKQVCVVGIELVNKLGLDANPIGSVIQVAGSTFTVVGVMEPRGRMFADDYDDLILIPFPTSAMLYGPDAVRSLRLDFQAADATRMDLAQDQIRDVLRVRHGLKENDKDDFRILLQEEILKAVSGALTSTSLIMGAVVGIALLVGGIGIMNIMLVSVTERTREIGIRKSMGARRRDILMQFLIEAVVLSGMGGLIGVAGGMLLGFGARQFIRRFIEFPTTYTPLWAVVLAFGFCALLGIIFGLYPAAKASKLDPIEALRYE